MGRLTRRLIFILPTILIFLIFGNKVAMVYLIIVNIGIYIYENRKKLFESNN